MVAVVYWLIYLRPKEPELQPEDTQAREPVSGVLQDQHN